MKRFHQMGFSLALVVTALAGLMSPAQARLRETDPEYQGLLEVERLYQVGDFAAKPGDTRARPARPAAIPDIFGPGSVLNVGNVLMKVTNFGLDGNPFTNLSSDPSMQWPGASSVEYMNFLGMAVGAVNPLATDPTALRRVSYSTEWRPPSLDAEDRIYRAYDGIVNGTRFVNDDGDLDPATGDERIDEDFLDGRDNDGDGKIDEDYAAIGQQMYSCVMRDDTPQAVQAAAAERHVPLGLECRKIAWAYSIPGYTDFNVIQYDFYNRSGHQLDSVSVAFRVDMDCGPLDKANYFSDDFDLPQYPHGNFLIQTKQTDLRLQIPHLRVQDAQDDSALCPRYLVKVNGFSCADDDGDDNKTPGIPTFMLIDHTIDPTGVNGPAIVGFRAFRSFPGGTPYAQGGNPTIDQQRYEMMVGTENVHSLRDPKDQTTDDGWISAQPGDQKGDYSEWASIGPWTHLPDGGHLSATVAMGVRPGKYRDELQYTNDYERAATNFVYAGNLIRGVTDATNLIAKYPSLDNALAAQIAFQGAYEVKAWPFLNDFHGRETALKAPVGQFFTAQGCEAHDPSPRLVNDRQYTWFDFDCDYCTGAYSKNSGGLFHRTWLAESPPPNPATNLSSLYNYTDNPDRRFIAAGDRQVTIAWDNLSEVTPDPKSGQFDFRGYKIWKVSNWQRPVGSGGPSEDDWTLLAEYRLFDAHPDNRIIRAAGDTICPKVFVPQTGESLSVCLANGDIWNAQSGDVIHPDPNVLCVGYPNCKVELGLPLGQAAGARVGRTKYPVGRYHYTDHDVKNGFVYFYSVTAFDSTGSGDGRVELGGRRSAVEAEGVVPQSGADTLSGGSKVWVVPNPYRGVKQIKDRPSSWDLKPNASDPTGTHVDFLGLPRGEWSIKIFTVSGDIVQTIKSTDSVNESIRGNVTDPGGTVRPGYNRQADNSNDGQARWNLISRNGQDVVSGIYLFTVEVGGNVKHRGKFVIIR